MILQNVTSRAPVENLQSFSEKEVLAACIEYFEGDELAATTWMSKYAMKNSEGMFLELTPDDMHLRMARAFAGIEQKYQRMPVPDERKTLLSDYGQTRKLLDEWGIYSMFRQFRQLIPQGSVMSALGNPFMLASLSNCVVLPQVFDSYGGIFHTDQQMAQLFKRRCGVGIDISNLRPAGARVANAAGTTTGAVSFMERFSNTTREVAQNGRRGALMITMDVAHPDVEDFITVKQDLSRITGANISVRLSDEFMKQVEEDGLYTHRWPLDAPDPAYSKTVRARELWATIIRCAHTTAEPGLIFWDRQHTYSTSSLYPGFKNVSTNPCSEIAMQGGDSCRLIALNLYGFVDKPFSTAAAFNFKKFYEVTYEGQRLMDDLVDLELEAIERIMCKIESDTEPEHLKRAEKDTWQLLYDTGKKGRRTGLGFTALADTLAALGLKFDSDEALVFVEKLMKCKCEAEFDSSIDMAVERGSFEAFDPAVEKESEFVQMLHYELPELYERMLQLGRRNISLSTVAPTGTVSMLSQTSSGIEPVFMLSYKRRRKVNGADKNQRIDFTDELGDSWQEFTVYHPKLKKWMETSGKEEVNESPYQGATATEIDWKKRIELQAVVQKYVTHSISSTINLPADVSEETVGQIYLESWRNGLKGITVYRDGSRNGVLLATQETKEEDWNDIVETKAPVRPPSLEAAVIRFQNDYEKWLAFVGCLNGKPYEIFTGRLEDAFAIPAYVTKGSIIRIKDHENKSRYDFQYTDKDGYKVRIEGLSRSFNKEYWNYAKLISGVLRHGMPLPYVVDLVSNLNLYNESINTWKNGVSRALKQFIPDGTQAADRQCPKCGDPDGIIFEEGCLKCKSCGDGKCS